MRYSWIDRFNFALARLDLKSLKSISPSSDVFLKIKAVLIAASNARRRDIMTTHQRHDSMARKRSDRQTPYTVDDYLNYVVYLPGYLDSELRVNDPGKFRIGESVKVVAAGRLFSGKTGVIVGTKPGGVFEVEMDILPDVKKQPSRLIRLRSYELEAAHVG